MTTGTRSSILGSMEKRKVTTELPGPRAKEIIARGAFDMQSIYRAVIADDVRSLVDKIANLRIFEDAEGKMNRSLLETGGGLLAVSQFTLLGDARKGRRPSFVDAAPSGPAEALYERFCTLCREAGIARVESGRFRTTMEVDLVNHGPVTILLDSRKAF